MKKIYSKPEIIFEDFTLTTNIAAGCEKLAGFAMGTCTYYDPMLGFNIFNNSIPDCVMKPPNGVGDEFNGICYHVPTESNNIFQS